MKLLTTKNILYSLIVLVLFSCAIPPVPTNNIPAIRTGEKPGLTEQNERPESNEGPESNSEPNEGSESKSEQNEGKDSGFAGSESGPALILDTQTIQASKASTDEAKTTATEQAVMQEISSEIPSEVPSEKSTNFEVNIVDLEIDQKSLSKGEEYHCKVEKTSLNCTRTKKAMPVHAETYMCNNGMKFVLSEPGITNPKHLCELDNLQTEKNPDVHAVNTKDFCQKRLSFLDDKYTCNLVDDKNNIGFTKTNI